MTSMTPTVSGDGIHCHASCNFELSMQLGAHGDAKAEGRKGACNDLERLQFQNVPMVVLLLFYCAHGCCLSVISLTSGVKITEREKTVFIVATIA